MSPERQLTSSVRLRVLEAGDAAGLARALAENGSHLAPWEPVRPESFFTEEGQRQAVARLLEEEARGAAMPLILIEDGRAIGRVTLSSIVRGPFQNANLGYWIARSHTGAGIMTRAVAAAVEIARGELGLHRIEAGTLLHNTASQRVLLRNGFVPYGIAPQYLRIAGQWQDHRLFQRILHG
ncbi:GNAT family N-acetyltransferase [Sinomonas sp. P10A9]|uniref:GNAT family N-acetyltransferase n=1 Tax=Sinomonas puerhi TaxID=3238584 RepID=A0AB39L5J5_9MICC